MRELIETLPILQRLALSYAPRRARDATLALLGFDNRIADTVRRTSEPVLAQIKLAWWREALSQEPGQWPAGEPLFALLAHWEGKAPELVGLVDGWEHFAGGTPLDDQAIEALAAARGDAFSVLAGLLGHEGASSQARRMGREWAIADLATRLESPEDREAARRVFAGLKWEKSALPRDLRPLTVLHGLAARSARKGGDLGEISAHSFIPAMRLGLLGF
ncbi:MAG: squalene/phytoene synthase family protein [Sphingomonadaceae bacterium]|nr:squalene/phytoene synthase family protein [Sphingomonadaceae bacterium]